MESFVQDMNQFEEEYGLTIEMADPSEEGEEEQEDEEDEDDDEMDTPAAARRMRRMEQDDDEEDDEEDNPRVRRQLAPSNKSSPSAPPRSIASRTSVPTSTPRRR